jgi:LysR family transcriptional regulator for bpeEF and oprC
MDQIQAMRLFVAVAETGSFTQAAERLGVPRATTSNAVMRTERVLGVKLFTRTTRSVKLSAEGQQYLERCRSVLTQWDSAHTMFANAHARPSGTVCIDLPERMANMLVIPALPDFLRRYPDIKVVVTGNSRFVDLVNEEVDCVVRVGELADSGLTARALGQMQLVNVASPQYLRQHGTPKTLADLAQHLVVGYISGRTKREMEWEYLDEGVPMNIKLPSQLVVSNTESYLAGCINGLGLIQSPWLSVAAHLRDGSLVEVLADFKPAPLPVSVLYTERRLQSARVRVLVEWLVALLGQQLQN